jgi:hypothetical protein
MNMCALEGFSEAKPSQARQFVWPLFGEHTECKGVQGVMDFTRILLQRGCSVDLVVSETLQSYDNSPDACSSHYLFPPYLYLPSSSSFVPSSTHRLPLSQTVHSKCSFSLPPVSRTERLASARFCRPIDAFSRLLCPGWS